MNLRMGLGPLMVCSAVLGVAQIASAQPKIAVINLQRAVLESAEIKKADADMQARYKPRSAAIEQLQKDIAGIAQQLQTNAGKFTAQAEAELTAQGRRSSATCSACRKTSRPMWSASATTSCRRAGRR